MDKALSLLIFLLCAFPSRAQIVQQVVETAHPLSVGMFTLVERQTAAGSCASGLTLTLGTATTLGELVVLEYFGGTATTTIAISDSGSQTYTKAYELTNVGSHYAIGLAYFLNSASGITTVTITNASDTDCKIAAEHWKRSTGSWTVDQTGAASATGVASPWSSPGVTTTVAAELLIGAAFAFEASGGQCVMAATGSWTGTRTGVDSNGNDSILLDQTVTTIQSGIQATGTTSTCTTGLGGTGNYPGIVTFK